MPEDSSQMGILIYGMIRSGTTLVADLLTVRNKSLVIVEPDLFVKWHEQTVIRIDTLLKTFDMPAPVPPDPQVHKTYFNYFNKVVVPELAKLDQWGIKQVNFLGWQETLDHYKPERLVLCVRDIRDLVLSAIDLINWQKLAFPGGQFLRDEGWIVARLCHDVHELMALKENSHHLVRYEDLVSNPDERESLLEFAGLDEPGRERLNLESESERKRLEIGKHGTGVSRKSVGRYQKEPPGPAKALAEFIWRLLPEYSRTFGYETPDEESVIQHPFSRPQNDAANPVKWEMVDTWNWVGPSVIDPAFSRRRARIAIAKKIKPGTEILDLGAVVPTLTYMIDKSCRCQYVDSIERMPDAHVSQWMEGHLPEIKETAMISALGVLEYVEEVSGFLKELRRTGNRVLVTYHATDDTGDVDRSLFGWRNHLSRSELEALLAGCGFRVKSFWKFDGSQSLFLLS